MADTYMNSTGLSRLITTIKNTFVTKTDPASTGSFSHNGNVSVSGAITIGAAPVSDMQVANKKYIDDQLAGLATLLDTINGEVV